MNKITRYAGVAVLGASLILTGCAGAGDANQAESTQTSLDVVIPAQPDSLDPHLSSLLVTADITRPVVETLVTVNADGDVVPMLAESYDVSKDRKTYTFHLREGLKFHDGSELDATDVVASMKRWTELTLPGKSSFPGATWSKEDASTVTLKVEKPSFLHLLQLSSRLEFSPAIMPSEIVDAAGQNPIDNIVGTGPYIFKDWVADQNITLEKWSEYQAVDGPRSGLSGDKSATLEKVTFNIAADESTRILGLQSGEYDLMSEVPFNGIDQIKNDPNLQLIQSEQGNPIFLVFSSKKGPFADVKLRQAVNMALDREAIMMGVVGAKERFELTHHQMTRIQENVWNTEVGRDTFNPVAVEDAKKLIAESGYDGTPVTLITTRDYPEAYNSSIVIQAQLEAIGIPVELEVLEWASWVERYIGDEASWDMGLLPAVPNIEPSQTVGFFEGRPGYWESDRLNKLMEEYRALPSSDDAKTFYDNMQQYIEDVRPAVRVGDQMGQLASTKSLGTLSEFGGTVLYWNLKFQ